MKRRRLIPDPLLMLISILGIVAFQVYWLQQNYDREKKALEVKAEMQFRETVMRLQVTKLKLDGVSFDSAGNDGVRILVKKDGENRIRVRPREGMVSTINVIREKLNDSLRKDHVKPKQGVMISMETNSTFSEESDSLKLDMAFPARPPRPGNHMFNFLYGVDSLQDTLRLAEIDSAYTLALKKQGLAIPFSIIRKEKMEERENPKYSTVTIGLAHQVSYTLQLGNTFPYLIRRIAQPVLYRNLRKQRKLAELKNEFISNITHELKTPIATVGVAIEALKNFKAIDNPERTREYLDISQNELHRLSLLVDKVLKLSMFENQGIELKYETLNLRGIVTEVVESLKLQLEKFKATVEVHYEGETELRGDRLHLLSVVFNLLDNALKYRSVDKEVKIDVQINGTVDTVQLIIRDNGIGISTEYQEKIFEKFFRVPHGDTHNAKGYGLGLSYVAQVIKKHEGTITVQSVPGESTAFTITLPKSKS